MANFTNNDCFCTIQDLGYGLQGKVLLCEEKNIMEDITTIRNKFALKTFKDNSMAKEKNMLTLLADCPFIVQLKNVKLPCHLTNNALTMEYYKNGELFHFMEAMGTLNERLAKTLLKQCLIGIQSIHGHGVVHRDIKPENIFIDESYHVRLGDFGLSCFAKSMDCGSVDGTCGTPQYMSPEVVSGSHPYNGFKADVWSLGCIFFLMLTGNAPFGERGACERDWFFKQWKLKHHKKFWNAHQKYSSITITQEIMNFFEKVFEINSTDRISIDGLLNDVWLNEGLLDEAQFYDQMDHIRHHYKFKLKQQF
jgi:serine/threonine protein kinase